ncbi:MAG: efflux RND transporter periplasmic adaptor subunit [Bryobacteraceae bacterium]|nr:efflux RND transporter periplasmic adaptor subunit [Bryobacteraceae bacterium]
MTFARLFSVLILAACAWVIGRQLLSQGNLLAPTAEARRHSMRVLPEGPEESGASAAAQAISGLGVIEPQSRETKVAGPGAGLIARILVSEGQQVRGGEPLVELESSVELAAVESAHEEIESARREMVRVGAGEREETVAASEADQRASQAKAMQSTEVLRRLEGLVTRELVTRDEYDRARRQAEQDRASAEAATARYAALARGARREDVAVQEARLRQAEKKYGERQSALRLRTIRAASAGTVLQIKYRPGEYYLPGGEPLLLLGNLSQRRARIDIDERDIARVHTGDAAYVTAPAFPTRRFPARVAEIGQRIGRKNIRTDDPKERIDTKILEVVLDLEGDAPALIPGLRVTAVMGEGVSR